ncbi:MAG: hypothetical protein JWO44_1731 [Bacteroidetes bacterium]|nr:hypothetical protein [Bacteroidota bacterium]
MYIIKSKLIFFLLKRIFFTIKICVYKKIITFTIDKIVI